MRLIRPSFIPIILFLLLSHMAIGQDGNANAMAVKNRDASYISFSLNYTNDAVFMGRKDTLSAPYVFPSITYYNKTGFYTTGSFSFLTRPNESRIDLFLITAGYDFTLKRFAADLSFTKYFFNADSYNVKSQIEADITASMVYDFNYVNIEAGAIVFFSNESRSDVFLTSGISHDFSTKNQKLQWSPTIGMYFGSQNFYEEYYINKSYGGGGQKGAGHGGGDITQSMVPSLVIEESEKFSLMAIAFSSPIWFVHKPFLAVLAPNYVIPRTPATLTTDGEVYKEDLDNTFYFTVGIAYVL
ncbi:hypothetical protein [Aestuariivivens sediminis]|uniref:hypothetical protein n=1 Tax=Aestuariivivens sediminis TaxID=2913557 RepID=UPI001F599916|nr:hypothetical protein [Aestuariivivens sediminis]